MENEHKKLSSDLTPGARPAYAPSFKMTEIIGEALAMQRVTFFIDTAFDSWATTQNGLVQDGQSIENGDFKTLLVGRDDVRNRLCLLGITNRASK
jgi:hypothetical protein